MKKKISNNSCLHLDDSLKENPFELKKMIFVCIKI